MNGQTLTTVMPRQRINVVFPRPLLDDLRRYVPARQRSRVVAEATAERLQRIKLLAVLDGLAKESAWKEEDHPEMKTPEDVDHWVEGLRQSWQRSPQELEGENGQIPAG